MQPAATARCWRVAVYAAALCAVAACSGAEQVSSSKPEDVLTEQFTPKGQSSAAATIREIERQQADARSRIGSYRQVTRDLDGLSTEGAELEAYFDAAVLTLADVTIFGESSRADLRLFYGDSGTVRLVERTEHRADEPHGATPDARTWRFYFAGDSLVAATVSDRIVDPRSDATAPSAGDLLHLSRRIAEVARQP